MYVQNRKLKNLAEELKNKCDSLVTDKLNLRDALFEKDLEIKQLQDPN